MTPHSSLLAILAQFSIAPATFDALRADAYEKHLAARSLTELEQFYTSLFDPALSYRQIQAAAPRWSSQKYNGRRPSLETLREIRQRIRLEQTADHLATLPGLMETLKKSAPATSGHQTSDLLNLISMLLGEELISAKLDGKPLAENLKVVDRLIKAEALRLRYPPPPPPEPDEPAPRKLTAMELRWLARGETEWMLAKLTGTTASWFAPGQTPPPEPTRTEIPKETPQAETTETPPPEPAIPEPTPTNFDEPMPIAEPSESEPPQPVPVPNNPKIPKPIYTPLKHSQN